MDINWIFDILASTTFEIPSWLLMLFLPIIGYFCWHNIHDYNDLCDCAATIDTNDATIFIPNEQAVNEDCTILNNIMLQIIKGGSLNVGEFSIRNATYEWEDSGTTPGEYYIRLVATGGDPGLIDPLKVYENDGLMTVGVLGVLGAGEWAYGNQDTLGYNTIYVKIAAGGDPDAQAVDFVEAGYVVTIEGWVEAGAYQIFEGYGSVVLGPLAAAAMFPEWYTG